MKDDDAALAALINMTEITLTEQQIAALTGTDMRTTPIFPRVPIPPTDRPLEQNSVTKLQALTPVRVATSKILDGDWVGNPLTAARVVGSMFGGKHFILQIGHEVSVGASLTFRLVFVAHMPTDDIESDAAKADALNTATAFMHMLNMRRRDNATPADKSLEGTIANINAAVMRAEVIPGDPLINIPGKAPTK